LALFAFAANSVLCRLAMEVEQVDAVSFTLIRLVSGATMLCLILLFKHTSALIRIRRYGSRLGALCLLVYAAGFSYAYLTLSTATGALILFSAVQFTMLFKGWLSGHNMTWQQRLGLLLALAGFIYFVSPALQTPSLIGCGVMLIAGCAWGIYSLIGAKSRHPLYDTASNFIGLAPIAIIGLLWVSANSGIQITSQGLLYTLASGALASGLGYSIWYQVLPSLPTNIAAVCQLSVPIWATLGGLLWVNEPIDLHLGISAVAILGGILIVILSKAHPTN
jgi:drug/metabolite transporter (DMT)-like permease